MNKNFIGIKELEKIKDRFRIKTPAQIPKVSYQPKLLEKLKNSHILILGLPVSINQMRDIFGTDPQKSEPCFYNQDWYLKEDFANKTLDFGWYLISKEIKKETRGKEPKKINESLPLAVLATYTFFVYYLLTKEKLWDKDFIWCKDTDHNGDQIYVGRYTDPENINKNGFNIHRHLKIRSFYGTAPQIP